MRDNVFYVIFGGVVAIILGLAILYTAGQVHDHNQQLGCLITLIRQALNEAFHHAKLAVPIC